jgi:hypothetical protein
MLITASRRGQSKGSLTTRKALRDWLAVCLRSQGKDLTVALWLPYCSRDREPSFVLA